MTTPVLSAADAAAYDAEQADMFEPAVLGPAVDALRDLSEGGPALEMAVGTGRVALALAAKGIVVSGIELSPHMAAVLSGKPSGESVSVTVGDMTTTRLPGAFKLVYLVFNSIMDLASQDQQLAAFTNAAAHLETGGRFVVEVFLPHALRAVAMATQSHLVSAHDGTITIGSLDRIHQVGSVEDWRAANGELVRTLRRIYRYVYPSELDLMARLAGLELEARWSDWRRNELTSDSQSQISVFLKPRM